MTEKDIPVKGEESTDKELEVDEKWRIFVTKQIKMSKRPPKVDEKELSSMMNPFTQELLIPVDIRLDPEAKVLDQFGCQIPASSVIEKIKYTKVYQSAQLRDQAMNLSATALRMYVFIMYEIEEGKDYVELNPEWYYEAAGKGSRNMYRKALDELMRYGYITTTKYRQWYWVNPRLIYCGNRIKKYPKNLDFKNTFTGEKKPKEQPVKKNFKGFGKEQE